MNQVAQRSAPPLAVSLRQFRIGLHQQMYYLGMDVMLPKGNWLIKEGFKKLDSPILKGTSCYHQTQVDGSRIELHGACIAWVPKKPPGIIYLRGSQHLRLWNSTEAYTPGDKGNAALASGTAPQLHERSKNIAKWWLDYELKAREVFPSKYRLQGFRNFKKAPNTTSWKSPREDLLWLKDYLS